MAKQKKKKQDAPKELFEPASLVQLFERVFIAPPREAQSNYILQGSGLVVHAFGGVAMQWNRKQARVKAAAILGMIDPDLLSATGLKLANAWEPDDGNA